MKSSDGSEPGVFEPPAVTVAEAGLLMHRTVGLPETSGTLLELGLLGALEIKDEDGKPQVLVLVNAARATHPHQLALLKALFPLLRPTQAATPPSLTTPAPSPTEPSRWNRR